MSEPNSPDSEPIAAVGQLAEDSDPEQEPEEAAQDDPWFTPSRRADGDSSTTDADASGMYQGLNGDSTHPPDEWFLRTGRAGLLPDAMIESWDDDDTSVIERVADSAGAPPWAGERPDQEVEEPPPWESGPWPGPGEERPAPRPRAASSASRASRPMTDDTLNWQSVAAAATGVLPLVLPGAVLGVLGLRRAQRTGTGRMASWIGIGLSAIWAIVLIIVLVAGAGGSGPGCTTASQADISSAMSSALHDLAANAPQSVVAADLNRAISDTNSAAVAAQQTQARDALAALTSGLQESMTAITASHSAATYSAVRKQLLADSTAAVNACKA